MKRAVYSAVVMEMRSVCQLKSTKHLFVLSPASYCAPRLNRLKKIASKWIQSDSEQAGCSHRQIFKILNRQNFCQRLDVWTGLNAGAQSVRVDVCFYLPSPPFLFLDHTDCRVKLDLTEVVAHLVFFSFRCLNWHPPPPPPLKYSPYLPPMSCVKSVVAWTSDVSYSHSQWGFSSEHLTADQEIPGPLLFFWLLPLFV